MGFPRDDYTPFGLLANPWAEARSWEAGSGGTLRATEQRPGFGWLEPWGPGPGHGFALEVGFEHGGRRYLTRADFAEVGLTAPYHSANLFEYCWEHVGLTYRVRFFSGGPKTLVAQWLLSNASSEPRQTRIISAEWHWTHDQDLGQSAGVNPPTSAAAYAVNLTKDARGVDTWAECAGEHVAGRPGRASRALEAVELTVLPYQDVSWTCVLSRDEQPAKAMLDPVPRVDQLLAADDAFWANCPRLSGDWPGELRRGLVYDFETTRMCLQPPGGIFTDLWPAWMVNWPRVVLAEGSLDMLRLSYAQPEMAQRAVLSMFRDAPAPNVPCVFKHGEPNMVAADGSVCGTSPAWCVPFYNLRRLYLRTLDRAWLAELYPYLAAYVRWWLENRSDEADWTVYKCTWEAGEDNSTRLDPDGEGDHVISQYARPVELQAAMAAAAATMAFFAVELNGTRDHGPPTTDDVAEWHAIELAALARVQRLWDPAEGRFRDWDVRRGAFVEPAGGSDYWGTDPRRFSPLSLTPLLFGQTTAEQSVALRREIEHYRQPPWSEWPSWSYVVLEAASRAGWFDFAGHLAYEIVKRIYRENDRRDLAEFERPMPGVAREYWPTDLSTWNASEGYGWGATTASFVIRQLCGFYEAEDSAGCAFRLAPAFPRELIAGRELRIGPLPYRGRRITLAYREPAKDRLEIDLELSEGTPLRAHDESSGESLLDSASGTRHRLHLSRGRSARVELLE